MRAVLLGVGLLGIIMAAGAAEHSDLWGKAGEKWTPASRLPDFSFAGYRCGEKDIPTMPPGVSVKDFGAKGDGATDDTAAFIKALATVKGALEVPPGRYKITKFLEIRRSGVVLRGAGPDKSILFFPIPMNEIKPDWGATTTGQRTSNYSWSGGFVSIRGSQQGKPLAQVTAEARRGETALKVSSAQAFTPGQRIEITQRDDRERTLTNELYSGDCGDIRKLRPVQSSQVCRVIRIEGDTVHFDRPLRTEVKLAWQPQIRSYAPSVTGSGIENLCFEFPNTPYLGHFTEVGYNAIALSGVSDCWVRNIRIVNCDSGLFPGGDFCTFQGVTFESARPQEKTRHATGHHGIYLGGEDNLFTGFDFRTRFMHDITVARCSGNVCSHGRGEDICFDHHKYAPFENLFSDIDVGEGTRPWQCGGGASLGKHTGARETFWNIRARRPLPYPPAAFGPWSMNLVGLTTKEPMAKDPQGKWMEAIKPEELEPKDIHQAQRERRLGKR